MEALPINSLREVRRLHLSWAPGDAVITFNILNIPKHILNIVKSKM